MSVIFFISVPLNPDFPCIKLMKITEATNENITKPDVAAGASFNLSQKLNCGLKDSGLFNWES
jgi:hypothetical protein